MCKQEFLDALRKELSGLPQTEAERSLAFYEECIDDRIEDGASEEDAVAQMGPLDEVVRQIVSTVSLPKLMREKVRPRRDLKAWEVVLLVLGAPAWVPLVLALGAVMLSVYLVLWSIVLTLFCVELSFGLAALAGVVAAVYFGVQNFIAQAVMMLGAGLIFTGLTLFGFFLCSAGVRFGIWLTKQFGLRVKRLFVRKGRP